MLLAPVALAPHPARLVPGVALAARDFGHEVHPVETGPRRRLGLQLADIETAGGLVRDDAVRHPLLADARGQGARVDAGDRDDAARLEPAVEVLGGAVVRRGRDRRAQDATAHARARRE